MALEIRQQLKLAQQLVMTPQLQQAIKLLQLNHLELADLIGQEMVENPVLEETMEERTDPLTELSTHQQKEQEQPPDPNTEERGNNTDIDWESYLGSYQGGSGGGGGGGEVRGDFDDLPTYDQTLTRATSLSEHLIWQLQMLEDNIETKEAAVAIIGNLDVDGYLRVDLAEIAAQEQLPIEVVEDGLACVHTLDPLGVGARDLRECLLLQVQLLFPQDRQLLALVDRFMPALEKKDYKAIARGLGVSFQRVIDMVRTLSDLEPKPGRQFTSEEPRYITPDVYVIKSAGEYLIQLNEEGVPKLRVSNYYRQVLSGAAKGDKEYIQEKLRSAQWLIRSIYQRQRTIYKVVESIIKQQDGFFEDGISKLRPMILRDVAEDIGMHESTVSRVTTNKYVHTHHGIFELKFFFNSSIRRSDGGGDMASEAVKQRIKQLVDEENPRKPYSDQAIVKLLSQEDIKIARRTVAKYRDMLGLPSSSQRKRLF